MQGEASRRPYDSPSHSEERTARRGGWGVRLLYLFQRHNPATIHGFLHKDAR